MAGEGRFQMIDADEENMDKLLLATGFGDEVRKMNREMRPIMEYSRDGDKYTVKYTAGGRETNQSFEVGKEIDHTLIDGRKAKVMFTREGNKLVELETFDGKTIRNERELVGDQLIITISYGGLVAKRVYKRL